MTWDLKSEAALEILLNTMTAKEQAGKLSLVPEMKDLFNKYIGGANSVLCIFLLYLAAFENVFQGGQLTEVVSREVLAWVKTIPREKSAETVAGMIAGSLTAILEDLIKQIGRERLDPATISRLNSQYDLSENPTEAKKTLMRRIKPSMREGGTKWVNSIKDVFGLNMPPELEGSLSAMITYRNAYLHSPTTESRKTISGEELKSWALASIILARMLITEHQKKEPFVDILALRSP